MSRVINASQTLTANPTSLDSVNSNFPGTYYETNVLANAFTDASSSTRAAFYTNTGSEAVTEVYLNFDQCADIPSDATIDSVSCSVKCGTQGTTYYNTRTVQLCAGTTKKGSATTMSGSNTSPTTHTLTVGTWTVAEIRTAKLYFYLKRGTQNTTTESTFSVYGATLTVNYTIEGTMYTIGASSNVTGVTPTPSSQEVFQGGTGEIRIDAADLTDLEITDNGIDITNSLVQHTSSSGSTKSANLGTYTLVSGTFNSSASSYFPGIVGNGVDASTTTSNYYSSGSGVIAVFTYDMAITDIPNNATIIRVYCQVNGHAESTSNANEYMCAQLISGSNELTTELNFKSIGTSNSTQTLECSTIPTIAQLANMKLQCRLGYYGGAINGATVYVEYTLPTSGQYYWTYSISNIAADHIILIDEAGVYVPPEEDPEYTYYSLTISSINATTNPNNGTTRVIAGTNNTITISPTDPQLTLALDNGVDITNQLVGGGPDNTYTVTTQVSGARYGFNLNTSTGYYVSTNNGVAKSASVARLNMNFESSCVVTIQYINYAEANYDYGMFGKLDTTVATDGLTASDSSSSPSDSTSNYQLAMASNSASAQTITYTVPSGQHYIDIKYGKDDATDKNNDTLQWKILSVEATETTSSDYTYTLNNVQSNHSLIFVFGNVNYYFITSSGTGCRLYPDGQQVKLEGDSYRLKIVPNTISDTVTLTDNNVQQTLIKEEGVDKYNNPVVSYSYDLTNINATHTLVITCVSTASTEIFYIKQSGSWVTVDKIYKKINGNWVEQKLSYLSENNLKYLKQGSQ